MANWIGLEAYIRRWGRSDEGIGSLVVTDIIFTSCRHLRDSRALLALCQGQHRLLLCEETSEVRSKRSACYDPDPHLKKTP